MRKVRTVGDVKQDESGDSETCWNADEETCTRFGGMVFGCVGIGQRLVGTALRRLAEMDGPSLVRNGHADEDPSGRAMGYGSSAYN